MTRKERIAATITGIALFCVAALFSIGLLLGLLDFGSTDSRFLPALGQMLLSVYGLCSILIPAFFFVAGAFCLSAKWNIQRAFILLVSIIPFFTFVVAERTCIAISNQDTSPLAFVKISSIIIIALLLVILEYLLSVTLASFIENRLKDKPEVPAERPARKERKVEEIEWGPQYTNAPHADPKDYEDNGELENPQSESSEAEPDSTSRKRTLSFLKNKPADLKHLFVQKISFANRKRALDENDIDESIHSKEETDVQENDQATESPSVETPKKKISFNWSIDDEGNVKGKIDPTEISDYPTDITNQSREQLQESKHAESSNENSGEEQEELSIDDEITVDPVQEDTIEIPSDDELDEFVDDASEGDENPEAEDYGSGKDEILFEDVDIIDQFERESQSLTSEIDPFDSGDEQEEEIQYDMEFEDPADESTEEPGDDFPYENDGIEEPVIESNIVDEPVDEDFSVEDNINEEIDESFMEDQIITDIKNTDRTANFNPDATGLGDIFSQMEQDARKVVEGDSNENVDPLASPVVDSNGNPVAANSRSDGSIKPAVAMVPPKKKKKLGAYKIDTGLLTAYAENEYWIIDEETKQASINLQETLKEFSIQAEIIGIRKGPVVTMFEILPAPGVKLSKIVGLADNIALRLAAQSVRIVAPIPGKRAVGIEIPNRDRAIVSFRECIEQNRPEWKKMSVPVILGKDIEGETQIMDLVKTPHLLIAGSTGAGKSVCVNSMILSILYKRSPSDVKMILIDPKVVELKLYNHIPHLLTPVITESKKAMQALQYCLCEMERRYAVLDSLGCRDISSYNKKIVDQHIATEKIPYLIVIIDEFADLMATTGKQLEGVVARLCAMSRAVGIHLVLATQRPSVDVITGLIKANIPSRIAFMVAAKTDSRIIIDQMGAEKLLGKGDMLYASATDPFPVRIQGAFISDQEVEDVVEAVKEWGEPEYIDDEIFVDDEEDESNGQMSFFNDGADDPLYDKALDIVIQAGKASASYIQRRLSIGYNRAARLVELMEERGIVGPANGSKPREIIHMP
ncbi:DNA translocase FtsK [Treponema sp.]|uniref:DNA translocase FtsK n=1 Tax=Treponema sp. TaxID=166 RepID=UPI00388FF8A4